MDRHEPKLQAANMRNILASLLMFGACASPPGGAVPAALAATAWMRVDDENAAPHFPTLNFEAERASGHAGCNRFFAAVRADGNALCFDNIGTTRMACAESGMAAERAMIDALSRTRAYRREGEALTLLDARGEVVARFTPQ
jgi:heat shock protein HslJ